MVTLTRVANPAVFGKIDCLELGDIRIYRIADLDGIQWPARALFSDLTDEAMRDAAPLLAAADIDVAQSTLAMSFNSYLIASSGHVVLIDAGIGNGKERLDRPAWHRRTGTFLADLAGLGFSPEQVDLVINTHLHADHVGWNTVNDGAGWRPTFPRARYVVPADELAYWRACDEADPTGQVLHGAYADSVRPLLEAGVLDAVDVPSEIAPGLRLEPAAGHSPGMAVVRLSAGENTVLFLADVIHHPIQFMLPDLGSNFCTDPAQSRATRKRILDDSAGGATILAPSHFASPAFGRLSTSDGGLRFSFLPRQSG